MPEIPASGAKVIIYQYIYTCNTYKYGLVWNICWWVINWTYSYKGMFDLCCMSLRMSYFSPMYFLAISNFYYILWYNVCSPSHVQLYTIALCVVGCRCSVWGMKNMCFQCSPIWAHMLAEACTTGKGWGTNILRMRQNGRHFADDIVKCIFLNEICCILTQISLKIVPGVPINNKPTLVQIIASCGKGGKPLPEPVMA